MYNLAIGKCTSPTHLAPRLKIFKWKFTISPGIEPRTRWKRGRYATIWGVKWEFKHTLYVSYAINSGQFGAWVNYFGTWDAIIINGTVPEITWRLASLLQHHLLPDLRRKHSQLVVQSPIILHENAWSHTAAAVTDLLRLWSGRRFWKIHRTHPIWGQAITISSSK